MRYLPYALKQETRHLSSVSIKKLFKGIILLYYNSITFGTYEMINWGI